MPIALYRIDDRLIHGQVVVGWGQPLNLGFIVLVDDVVAESDWEQELYRLGVPTSMDVYFVSIREAAREMEKYAGDRRTGMVLTGTVQAMLDLVRGSPHRIPAVNIGGIHHREDRTQKMRYVFLNAAEEQGLRSIAALGVTVTAQDVPSAPSKSLDELMRGGFLDVLEVFDVRPYFVTHNPDNYVFSGAVLAYRTFVAIFEPTVIWFWLRAWWIAREVSRSPVTSAA